MEVVSRKEHCPSTETLLVKLWIVMSLALAYSTKSILCTRNFRIVLDGLCMTASLPILRCYLSNVDLRSSDSDLHAQPEL